MSGEGGRGLLLGVAVAAVGLAGVILFATGEEPAGSPSAEPATHPAPVAEAPSPPGHDDAPPPPVPAAVRFQVATWAQVCDAAGRCQDKRRAAARVSVRDSAGEVAGYDVGVQTAAGFQMPWGDWILVAKDADGDESEPRRVPYDASRTATVAVDLVISKKP